MSPLTLACLCTALLRAAGCFDLPINCARSIMGQKSERSTTQYTTYPPDSVDLNIEDLCRSLPTYDTVPPTGSWYVVGQEVTACDYTGDSVPELIGDRNFSPLRVLCQPLTVPGGRAKPGVSCKQLGVTITQYCKKTVLP